MQYGQFLPRDAMLSAIHAVVVCLPVCMSVCLSHSGIVSQEALLWQRDSVTRLSVEILQLQNIQFENWSPGPFMWHYLRDATFFFIQYQSVTDRQTHTHTQTDGQTHDLSLIHI